MKHNNQIDNQHFRKDWQRRVVQNLNQPAQKLRRRIARKAKAQKIAPRPIGLLRPAVRCTTVKYNSKLRAGRGFTFDELKAAGINKLEARGIGIAVDHRRKNRSEEGFQANVRRLKFYKSKLVIFPRNPSQRRQKKGDSSAEEIAQIGAQNLSKTVLTISNRKSRPSARAITEEERNTTSTAVARKALVDGKLWGVRERRAKLKAEENAKIKPGK